MTSNNQSKGVDGAKELLSLRSSGMKVDTNNLFGQLKELVAHIEKEMEEKQEELEVQAEELEVQNEELRENYEALRKAEEASSRLSLIVESSDDAIISKSLDGVITSWNAGAERMFGYTASEVIGKHISILVPPGHHDEIPDIIHRIKNGERIDHFDTVRMGKDGKQIHVSVTVSPIKDKSGMIVGASSIKRDITRQKQMEEENLLLASIVKSSDDAIISKTMKGVITSWNAGAERMFGYSAGEVLGKSISILVPPGHHDELPNILGRIKRGEHIDHFETVRMRKDGSLVNVSVTVSPTKDRSGAIVGASSIKRDITLQKQLEEALQERQEELEVQAEELEVQNQELRESSEALQRAEEASSRLASIVESSDDAIIGKSLDGVITSWNAGAERMFGYTASEVIGKHISILVPPGHHDEIPDIIHRIKNGERIDHFETTRMAKGGKQINVSVTVSPIKDKSGMIVGASSIKRDITRQKQMEKELQEKQEEIEVQAEELEVQNEELRTNNEELQEAKMQSELYLDLMGHDISNMHQIAIAQLELATEILDEDGRLENDHKELIDTPRQTLERSARLIENVRNLQKVKAGAYSLETIDLGKMLAEIVKENSSIPNRNVTINYTPADHCLVKATPLLKDVLNNLVDNAIKHNNGLPVIDITIKKVDGERALLYEVYLEDNGVGIPDSKKEELFHRFKRGQTKARGTGLGLYIVKTLVESFHGRVMVEDRVPGDYTKGSRFIIVLPAVER